MKTIKIALLTLVLIFYAGQLFSQTIKDVKTALVCPDKQVVSIIDRIVNNDKSNDYILLMSFFNEGPLKILEIEKCPIKDSVIDNRNNKLLNKGGLSYFKHNRTIVLIRGGEFKNLFFNNTGAYENLKFKNLIVTEDDVINYDFGLLKCKIINGKFINYYKKSDPNTPSIIVHKSTTQ